MPGYHQRDIFIAQTLGNIKQIRKIEVYIFLKNPVLLEGKLSHFPPVSHCCVPLSAQTMSGKLLEEYTDTDSCPVGGKALHFPPISRRCDPIIAQTMSSKPPEEQIDNDITQTLGKH